MILPCRVGGDPLAFFCENALFLIWENHVEPTNETWNMQWYKYVANFGGFFHLLIDSWVILTQVDRGYVLSLRQYLLTTVVLRSKLAIIWEYKQWQIGLKPLEAVEKDNVSWTRTPEAASIGSRILVHHLAASWHAWGRAWLPTTWLCWQSWPISIFGSHCNVVCSKTPIIGLWRSLECLLFWPENCGLRSQDMSHDNDYSSVGMVINIIKPAHHQTWFPSFIGNLKERTYNKLRSPPRWSWGTLMCPWPATTLQPSRCERGPQVDWESPILNIRKLDSYNHWVNGFLFWELFSLAMISDC